MIDAIVGFGHWSVGKMGEVVESKQETNTRYKMIRAANEIAFPSTVAMIVGVVIIMFGLAALAGSVAAGLILIGFGAAVFVLGHDVHACCDNLRLIHSDAKKRGKVMMGDSETFVDEMLKNTWIFKDFFKGDILGAISEAEARDKARR